MADSMLATPVVLVAFNRPDVTRRNIAALREVRPGRLFLVADGPRSTHPDDHVRCAQVRELLTAEQWPGHVETRFADHNLGLEASIELGLDWVFGQVDRAIVLEDDCIPDPTFFYYCEELLERYAGDPRVWQIGGEPHGVPSEEFAGASYAFSTWTSVWGWATWADRWRAHRRVFDRDHAGAEDRVGQTPRTAPAHRVVPTTPHPDALATDAGLRHFTQVAQETNGDLRGWDHHWWVTIMAEQGLSVTPALTLVEHDGYGEGATHTRSNKEPEPAVAMPFPLVHPPGVELNRGVEAELERVLLRTDGRLSRWARWLVRPLWLRALVRGVMTRPLVWRVLRRLVAR